MDWEALVNTLLQWATNTGVKIVIALVVMFISFKIINAFAKRIIKKGSQKNADKTIIRTLAYVFKVGLKIIVIICLIFSFTSFINMPIFLFLYL